MKAAGVAAWIDQIDIPPGDRWDTAIEKALRGSDCVVVVLSRASVESANVLDEVSFALDERKRVVPVMMESVRSRCDSGACSSLTSRTGARQHSSACSPRSAGLPCSRGEQLPSTAGSEVALQSHAGRRTRSGSAREYNLPSPTTTEKAHADVLRPLYIGALAVAIVAAIGIYVVFESRLSETTMVTLSYFWVPRDRLRNFRTD